MTQAPPEGRLPYDRLVCELRALPAWVLHPTGSAMTRELSFASSGPALLFVQAAGLLARLERRWPEISWARERVWITLRNLELGLTQREATLAGKLEQLFERCAVVSLPEPPLPPASFADLEELVEVTFTALRGLHAELRDDRGSDSPGPLRALLEELSNWEPEPDGEGLMTEFALPGECQAKEFVELARELAAKEGWRVELMAAGRLVGVIVRPSDARGLTEREVAAARALERLYGVGPTAGSTASPVAGEKEAQTPLEEG